MRTGAITALFAACLALGGVSVASAWGGVEVAARSFADCAALNKVYPHGVGKWSAIAAQLHEPLECDALIVGGWKRSWDDIGSFGVRLLLPSITVLRTQIANGRWTG